MRAKTLGAFFILSLILLLSQSGISLAQDPPPGVGSPITISDDCMQDIAGFGLVCTANDVSLARATNITITDACEYPGDTVTFMATFETVLTAQARHDIGIYFATNGDPHHDGALTGQCSISSLPYSPDPPWLDLDGTDDYLPGTKTPANQQDVCGDIDAGHSPLYPVITVTTSCLDPDGDGWLNLPYCTSWRQPGANEYCAGPKSAFPGAPSASVTYCTRCRYRSLRPLCSW